MIQGGYRGVRWDFSSNKVVGKYEIEDEDSKTYNKIDANLAFNEMGYLSKMSYDEIYEYECMAETFEETLLEIEIGQLYAKYTDNEFIDDFSGNIDYALCCLADSQRKAVYGSGWIGGARSHYHRCPR